MAADFSARRFDSHIDLALKGTNDSRHLAHRFSAIRKLLQRLLQYTQALTNFLEPYAVAVIAISVPA
ncbi:hypothetical protein D3C77_732080 [compost metagenome]